MNERMKELNKKERKNEISKQERKKERKNEIKKKERRRKGKFKSFNIKTLTHILSG